MEINVPEKASDDDLIDSASGFLSRTWSVFYTENMPANLVASFVFQFAGRPAAADAVAVVNERALLLQQDGFATLLPDEILHKNLRQIATLISALERRGARVFLFEMPVQPQLENMPRSKQIREAFRAAFPERPLLDYEQVSKGVTVSTSDGVHLTAAAAKQVANNLANFSRVPCLSRGAQ